MKELKKYFETPQKAIISILVIITVIALIGAGTVVTATSLAENSSIGKESAQNFAFVDAGIDPVDVKGLKTEFEFEYGQFVYDVEFVYNGREYEYWIKASDGSILKKEVDIAEEEKLNVPNQETSKETSADNQGSSIQPSQDNYKEKQENTKDNNNGNQGNTSNSSNNNQENSVPSTSSKTISLEEAKKKALSDAGLSNVDVTFTKTQFDRDDGITLYEIEFYTTTQKYDYEINASTGEIHSKEVEKIKSTSTGTGSLPQGNTQNNNDNHSNHTNNNSNSYIGVERAKEIALNHAGVSNVTFKKSELDRDDGRMVYEIEFYKNSMEYSYEIDATTGNILDYDIDRD